MVLKDSHKKNGTKRHIPYKRVILFSTYTNTKDTAIVITHILALCSFNLFVENLPV